MPFFRPLNITAPHQDPDLPWPVDGLVYVGAFAGPISAGPLTGFVFHDWGFAAVGLLAGIGIDLLNGWLSDRFLDPLIARHQRLLLKPVFRVPVNILGFLWALAISALSMLTPLLVWGWPS